MEFAREYKGIDDAYDIMDSLRRQADDIILQFPESESRQSFRDIFDYIISRDR